MGTLLLFALAVIIFLVVRTFFRIRAEQRLRDNFPERRIIEITLPTGIDQSRFEMAKFWRKVHSTTTNDPKARKVGQGQIDFVYLATVAAPGSMPQVTCLIYTDPEQMELVKRAIKGQFRDCDVIEHEQDPLSGIAEALKPKPEQEPEYIENDPQEASEGADHGLEI
jgi:hypothetical protein